jgi:hypothetical protein
MALQPAAVMSAFTVEAWRSRHSAFGRLRKFKLVGDPAGTERS